MMSHGTNNDNDVYDTNYCYNDNDNTEKWYYYYF